MQPRPTSPALRALLSPDKVSRVIVATQSAAAVEGAWRHPWTDVIGDHEVVQAVEAPLSQVIVVRQLTPLLIRALLERRDEVLVVMVGSIQENPTAPELARRLPAKVRLLGPDAQIWCDPHGEGLAIATSGSQLQAIVGDAWQPRVALCPGAPWLGEWVSDAMWQHERLVGWVDAAHLNRQWISAQSRPAAAVLVPLRVPTPSPHQARQNEHESAAIAHYFELVTGPVIPSPPVMRALAQALQASPTSDTIGAIAQDDALWQQSARALPEMAAVPGMDRPDIAIGSDPALAFLAQRTVMRARENQQALARLAHWTPASVDSALQVRALEVLRAAAEKLSDQESKVVLRGFGFNITRQALANSASGAATFADRIGYPVAIKAASTDIGDKVALGAVELDVPHAAGVRRAYTDVLESLKKHGAATTSDGVVVAEMVAAGIDIECGAVRLRDESAAWFARVRYAGRDSPLLWAPVQDSLPCAIELAQAVLARHASRLTTPLPDQALEALAEAFWRLACLLRATDERILRVHLHPLRLLDGERTSVVLDAMVVQRAHLEGL